MNLSAYNPIHAIGRLIHAVAPSSRAPAAPPLNRILIADARQRWMSQRAKDYTPDSIETILSGAFGGNLVQQYELFDLMEVTWPRLLKNLGEIKDSVTSLDWTLQPWSLDDAEPTPEAKRKRDLVEEIIWHMRPDPTADENDFEDTIRDALDAWGKGMSVLEIDWEQRATSTGTAIAPRATHWIHPRFYGYEYNNTRLQLNAQEIATANAQVRNEEVSGFRFQVSGGAGQWTPFPANKFIVAVAKAKTGHPIGAALMRPLAFWWCAANFSASWLLNHAQLFGVPIRWATYDPQTPNIKTIIQDMLENMGSAGWAAVPTGTQLQILEAVKGSTDNPNVKIIDIANTICDILLLRQTLTTSQGDKGSQALGTVHQSIRGGAIDAAAKWAAKVINTQLIPAILRLNFSDDSEAPWFDPSAEEQKDEKALADRDQVLANMGLEFPEQWFRERHGVPPIEPGQPTIGGRPPVAPPPFGSENLTAENTKNAKKEEAEDDAPVTAAAPLNPSTFNLKPSPASPLQPETFNLKPSSNDWRQAALAQAMGIVPEWLAPLQTLFDSLETALKDPNKTDAEVLAWVENAAKQFPGHFREINLPLIARRLETAMSIGVQAGIQKAEPEPKPELTQRSQRSQSKNPEP